MLNKLPLNLPDIEERWRSLVSIINQIIDGRSNAVGTFTLTASNTSTTINDARVGVGSHISWTPTTSSASTASGAGMYYSRTAGSFTITHASNSATDQVFTYGIVG